MFPISLPFLNFIYSLARVTCETSQFLLAAGQVVFSGISHFRPTLRLTWLKMSKLILTSRKTQIRKRRSFIYDFIRQRTVCSFGSISTDVSKTAHSALWKKI